jgi:hypothetical protein
MSDELPGFRAFITEATVNDVQDLLDKLREHGLPVEHSLFATIHHKSEERPEGFSEQDLDEISGTLAEHDRQKWIAALEAHLAGKSSSGAGD